MERHPYFDLWLHTDAELAERLGSAVLARETLHEWPLSCVQRLTLVDGRTLVYKSQRGPTVEADFYARARSPLLVRAEILDRSGDHVQMTLDYVDAPLLEDLDLTEADTVRIGRDLLAQVDALARAIEGEVPVLVDIGTVDAWNRVAHTLVADLRALVAGGQFVQVGPDAVAIVAQWAESAPLLDAIRAGAGLVHEDFTADNIFRLPDGYRVIDWQRVALGPPAIALALLLESLGFDPLKHVSPGVVALMILLRMRHLVASARTWFPPGIPTYDGQIAGYIVRLRDLGG
jgi:hypothetical protein